MRKNFVRFRSVDEIVVAWRNFNKHSSKVSSVEWNSINWEDRNHTIVQIRRRIYFKAVELNSMRRLTKVECLDVQTQLQSLQRKLIFCQSNLLVSTKQVLQPFSNDISFKQNFYSFNVTDSSEVSRLVTFIKYYVQVSEWKPSPLLFTDSPQKNIILRVPIIIDHIIQSIVKNALEPVYEIDNCVSILTSRSFNNSYDAIDGVIESCTLVPHPWIITAEIGSTFEIISFDHLKSLINTFPFCDLIIRWLNCRFISSKNIARFLSQGVIFPLLLKIILDSFEKVFSSSVSISAPQYSLSRPNQFGSSVMFIRCLSTIVLVCEMEFMAQNCKQLLINILGSQGLRLLKPNIHISCLSSGFNYLGVNIRAYSHSIDVSAFSYKGFLDRRSSTCLLLAKPSKLSVLKIKRKIKSSFIQYRSCHLSILIKKVNPLIKDWSLYYGRFCSQKTFLNLDFYLYVLQYHYGARNHPNKGRAWVTNKYFGLFNLDREDKWVFGFSYLGKLYYMEKFSWIPRIR